MAGLHVLVVDDEPSIAETIGWVLRDAGYVVTVARNGREALDRARSERPDLVITDIMMPVMDGWALCRALEEDPTTRGVPVIVMTALPHLAERGGATFSAYLPKPFELDALSETVERVIAGGEPAAEYT